MGKCSGKERRGMGSSTYIRIAEIMSGRSYKQQGLAATCKDSLNTKGKEGRVYRTGA
jgi:hypothetical protein